MDLAGKVAIVTGGGTGLGREITLALARSGTNVVIIYSRSEAEAVETRDRAIALGVRAAVMQADVGSQDDPADLVARVEAEFGRLDILVANAATADFVPMGDLDGVSLEAWDRVMNVNVRGPWLYARAVAKAMNRAGGGRIVTISSASGLRPFGSSLTYCVSKAALIHLTRCLAVAMAPSVLVNSVAPGYLETGWGQGQRSPSSRDRAVSTAVLGRPASLEDVSEQVLTLLRTDSITGQTIVVDGGTFFH